MRNFSKKVISFAVIAVMALELLFINTSAQGYEIPESTPLFVKKSIESGEIALTDDIMLRLQICDAIYRGLYDLSTEVSLDGLIQTPDQHGLFIKCLQYVLEYPDMFQAKSLLNLSNIKLSALKNERDEYLQFKAVFEYKENVNDYLLNSYFDKELALVETAEYEILAKAIAEKVPENSTDIEKMLFVYDYMATNFEYDVDAQIFDAYQFLKKGRGVCDSYAKTFNKIMELLGVPTIRAISDTDSHAWSIVLLDGEYYHVDTTWADPLPDRNGKVEHNAFLKSTSALPDDRDGKGHDDWYVLETDMFGLQVTCDSTKYNSGYVWEDAIAAFATYNGEHYYIDDVTENNDNWFTNFDKAKAVIRKTTDFVNYTDVLEITSDFWTDPNGSGYRLTDYNSGLFMLGPQIYYNTSDTVYYYDTQTKLSGRVFKVKNSNIAGFRYIGKGRFEFTEFSREDSEAVFTKKNYTLENMGPLYIGGSDTLADDLISIRKYLDEGTTDNVCLIKADISSDNDGVIDVRDLVALKKMATN